MVRIEPCLAPMNDGWWMTLCIPLVQFDHIEPIDDWLPYMGRHLDAIYAGLVPHQKAALASLWSDVGYWAIARSNVRFMLDLGRVDDAMKHWRTWVNRDGVWNKDMVVRREREIKLYLG